MTTAAATTVTQLRSEALSAVEAAPDQRALDAWRVEYLGRKGRLTGVLRGLTELSIDERKAIGASANGLKVELEAAYDARSEELRHKTISEALEDGKIDVTLPPR